MRRQKPEVYTPKREEKKNSKKTIVIIEIIALAALVAFIIFYKEERVIKTIDMSKPSPMITISKKETEEPEIEEKAEEIKNEAEDVKEEPKEAKKEPEKIEEESKEKKPTEKEEKKVAAKKVEKGGFYLQLGAFAMKENYEKLKGKAEKLGFQTDTKIIKKKVTSFKVTLGRFSSEESANEAFDELERMGFDPKLTELGDGKYEVSISTIFYKSDAEETIKKLAKNNIKGILKETTETSDVYVLRVGPYGSRKKAVEARKELMKKGFEKPYLFSQ